MKLIIFSIGVMLLISCNSNKPPETFRYQDEFRENFKGEPRTIERFNFLVENTGKLIPDSLYHEVGEWKGGYLRTYRETDSNQKNISVASYFYYDNGQVKTIKIDLNGKPKDRHETDLDSNGRSYRFISYDSAGKITAYTTNIIENDSGLITAGKMFGSDSALIYNYVVSYKGKIAVKTFSTDSSGKENYSSTLRLNDNDDMTEDTIKTFNKDSAIIVIKKYRYDDYDSLKNWLQRTELNPSGAPIKVTKRKISYAK